SPTAASSLSLHDALPIFRDPRRLWALTGRWLPNAGRDLRHRESDVGLDPIPRTPCEDRLGSIPTQGDAVGLARAFGYRIQRLRRSEEHTSELQSRSDLVC